MEKSLIIYGVGKFAEYAAYIFDQESDYSLEGFTIEEEYLSKSSLPEHFKHLKLWNYDKIEKKENQDIFIAVGNNEIRARIFKRGLTLGYNFASFVSPRAITYKNLKIGRNVFISEGSIIHPFTQIHDNNIIIGGRVGHHSIIGENCLLSSCILAGNTTIGNNCYLGINSTVSQNVKIADFNILSMNVSIDKVTLPNTVFSHRNQTASRFPKNLQSVS